MQKVRCVSSGIFRGYSLGFTVLGILLLSWSFLSAAVEINVGKLTPGSTDYPDAALKRLDVSLDFRDDHNIRCTLLDDEKRYAYLGTMGNPARIIKMDFGTSEEDMPVYVATLLLEVGEAEVSCGIIDSEAGFAWFGTDTNPAKIIKVALGEGSAPPERLGAITLPLSEPNLVSAVWDRATNTAFFGSGREPARVVKMDLRSGNQLPERVGSVVVDPEERSLFSVVFDSVGGYLYFGAFQTNKVFKIDPGASGQAPSVVGSVSDITSPSCAVLDPEKGRAWFGSMTSPGKIFRINLGEGNSAPQLVDSITLASNENNLYSAVLDADRGVAFFGAGNSSQPGRIIKVSLGEEEIPFERMVVRTLPPGETALSSAAIDPEKGYAWFSSMTSPAQVIKMKLHEGYELSHLGSMKLTTGENAFRAMLMDSQARYAWISTETAPAKIVKAALYEGTDRPRRLGSIDLAPNESTVICGTLDETRGYAWFGTFDDNPGKVVMVALGEGEAPPERHGVLSLNSGEYGLGCVVTDSAREYAYFGTESNPVKIVKIALNNGDELPTRVGVRSFGTGFDAFYCAAYDEVNNLLYFGSQNGHIVRVHPGVGNAAPQILASYHAAEFSPRIFSNVLLDPVSGYGWFGTLGSPGRIIKVDIDPERSFGPVGSLTFTQDHCELFTAIRDPQTNRAYYGTNTTPAQVMAVDLGQDDEAPSLLASITLNNGEGRLRSATLHPEASRAWFTSNGTPGKLIRLGMGHSNAIQGSRITLADNAAVTKVHFYSHRAAGSLRLAIYDTASSPNLLWQSHVLANTVNQGWVTVPVGNGFPQSLALPAGAYWLAFQVDSSEAVPSWSAGTGGSGFSVVQSFGDFPDALVADTPTAMKQNDSQWSLYLTYDNHIDAPSDPKLLESTEHALTWGWTDNTATESGFKVWANPGSAAPVTLRDVLPSDTVSWIWDGLTPNCLYSFQVAATLFSDSDKTPLLSSHTLAPAAELGVSLTATIPPDTPCMGGTVFQFSNPAGFGLSTHGVSPAKVSAYRYLWNTAATHDFNGTENLWSNGTLNMVSAAVSQNYYLHLQSMNGSGQGGGTFSYGPFVIDADPPNAPTVSGPPLTKEKRPQWVWQSGGGGTGTYSIELNGSGIWQETESLSFTPEEDLPEGSHILRVRERDEVGNWSPSGSFTININFSSFSAVILPLNPLETEASLLTFQVTFSQTLGTAFTKDYITATGSLTGDITVSGADLEYLVSLQVHDPDADGEVGISIAGNEIADIYGNVYGGGVSPFISIRKWHSPYFLVQPEGARTYTGAAHLFQARPHSTATTMSFQWKAEREDKSVILGPETFEWLLDPLELAQAGSYWCEVSYDGVTRNTEAVNLELEEALELTQLPQGAKVGVGGSHRFLATVRGGYLPLHFSWYKDGMLQPLLPDNPDLSLSDLSPEDSGMYHLVISDSNGTSLQTPPVPLEVIEATLPIYGTVSIGLLGLLVGVTGLYILRQRESVCSGDIPVE